jgi:2,4-dienoyl-CoA reductase-like NADH-dependent reductase (Old Yellow Enzyme family)
MPAPLLFTSLRLRALELPNRIVVPPMAQYVAQDGVPVDHHLVHYGRFAQGGAGLVFIEATAVTHEGRITNGDLGLWSDAQIAPLARIAGFLKANGSVPAIQLAHAGRKAAMQRPWHGNGPQTAADRERGDATWPAIAPSAEALDAGWQVPREMNADDRVAVIDGFAMAARRALAAGFEAIEVHMAHGYLLHSWLSPLSNHRTDRWGGSREGRMRFPLEVAAAVREAVPADRPVFVRISAVDAIDDGWQMDDSVALAHELKARGIDVVDCSSGGNSPRGATNTNLQRAPGFQAPFAARIRAEVGIATMAVGLVRTPELAERLLGEGAADLIAVGRQFLFDPFWARHAAEHFGLTGDFEGWAPSYAWWLEKWARGLRATGSAP